MRIFFALLLMDTSLRDNQLLVSGMKAESRSFVFYESFLESAPQLIFQFSIFLRTGSMSMFIENCPKMTDYLYFIYYLVWFDRSHSSLFLLSLFFNYYSAIKWSIFKFSFWVKLWIVLMSEDHDLVPASPNNDLYLHWHFKTKTIELINNVVRKT